MRYGVCGLIGIDSKRITENLPVDVERKIFTLKKARSSIPATKMVTILKGFNHNLSLSFMRHIYASHGWLLELNHIQKLTFGL